MYRKLLILIVFLFFSLPSSAHQDIWINVDTENLTLAVMNGEAIEVVFDNIAIGRFGASKARMKNDDRTPLGSFRIGWIKEKSQYYRFYGFNYPTREVADLALAENRIDKDTWQTIINAIEAGRIPPQNTPLGGYLGIHGIGKGDRKVHEQFNWTNGCIALTNEQLDKLSKWLKPGVLVEIR
ncbi:MAG TPA: murein L,D-transpeptidase [Nitrosomonas nitrosa]|jgi:hypothetical protein|uniref:L,D-transpeptidase catalytic domain n=1 Tax=Nitrosomonas nitrosa TaxID=52442 RepID=A0A1I4R0F8_9PROT|nr:L,D-transpeptidase [Nitrosomonas nitrosa]PTR00125.1 L,D-transpeptidase-like protein [Nitrosomonas nitrosa]CAE6509404.1 L,D-transpeptidase catalytic domain [Nitrosomonas nitrosa]SFM45575.1 L,D-transpeptidase catalytic domain [Nitrosomonas nitrosa]HBZ30245.1 murein L,D-transpeptidase [Nitrosomonas nitrosa]